MHALFVDYSKTFDRDDHNTLLNKMMATGIPKVTVKRLFLFLNDRQRRIKQVSTLSDWAGITGGMPQGSLNFNQLIYKGDPKPSCIIHTFMDNVTLTEVITCLITCLPMGDFTF